MADTYDPKPTPVHDLADLVRDVGLLQARLGRLLDALTDPPDVPDLTDYRTPVTRDGHRYRVVGGTHRADGTVSVDLEPDSGPDRPPRAR